MFFAIIPRAGHRPSAFVHACIIPSVELDVFGHVSGKIKHTSHYTNMMIDAYANGLLP